MISVGEEVEVLSVFESGAGRKKIVFLSLSLGPKESFALSRKLRSRDRGCVNSCGRNPVSCEAVLPEERAERAEERGRLWYFFEFKV